MNSDCSRSNLTKLQRIKLQVETSNIQPSSVVRDLSVYMDLEVTMKEHVAQKSPLLASTTFVVCTRFVVGSVRKLHSSWSWRS